MRFKTFFLACATSIYVNFYLEGVIYPEMVAYNGEIAAASYINQNQAITGQVYVFNAGNNIFQFYCNKPVSIMPVDKFEQFKSSSASSFYADRQTMNLLVSKNVKFRVIKAFLNYPKETFTADFIDKANRQKALDMVYLITK